MFMVSIAGTRGRVPVMCATEVSQSSPVDTMEVDRLPLKIEVNRFLDLLNVMSVRFGRNRAYKDKRAPSLTGTLSKLRLYRG